MAKRLNEEKIFEILKEAEQVDSVREMVRKYNVSDQGFYRWRKRSG